MVKKQKAFTLVETVISMMIIAIVAIGSLSGLTKMKPRIDSITIRGQYGCWYWDNAAASDAGVHITSSISDGQLVEWYFDERTERTVNPTPVTKCRLKLDQRPAHFYILASGAGDGSNPAQVSSIYTPAINNELVIEIGKHGLNTKTTVTNGDQPITAGGAVTNNTTYPGFYPANIRSCKVVQAPSAVTSCDVINVTTYNIDTGVYSNEYKIRLNGLNGVDASGNPTEKLLSFNGLSYQNPESLSSAIGNASTHAMVSSNNRRTYWYSAEQINGVDVFLSFDYHDSSFVPNSALLGFGDDTYSLDTRSKMTKILENISIRRQSKLTQILSRINAGGPQKDGAVFVMW